MDRAVCSWSGGKDAAMALYETLGTDIVIEELLTTVSESTGRSSMHGVRASIYRAQADAIGLPITIIELPDSPSNDVYESIMNERMAAYHERGFDRVVFGDLHLEDVREYRESRLADVPIDGYWPIWGQPSATFIEDVLDAGFEAIVVAVTDEQFDRSVVGTRLDREFLRLLPDAVDPAGENGSFHTLVVDGPIFDRPLSVERGDRVTKEVGEDTVVHYSDIRLAE